MENTAIVIMSKNNQTGFLEKEIGSYFIKENDNLIVNIYAVEDDNGTKIHLKIATDRDIEDWEFNAIYDYYDDEAIKALGVSINEIEDCYNPTWEVVFDFSDLQEVMEEKIVSILNCHKKELIDVYESIEDKRADYI